MVGRMALALLGARPTGHKARLDRPAHDGEIGFRLAGHDSAGRVADVAVEIEPNAP
jgi:hypothetical protein